MISEQGNVLSREDLLLIKKAYIGEKSVEVSILENHFGSILTSLETANGVGDYRVICCDTLSIWTLRATQLALLVPSSKSVLLKIVNREKADSLFRYVLDFWNESGSPLGNSLKEMFVKLVALLNKILDHQLLYRDWLEYVLRNIPFTLRVCYFMVETLCNQIKGSSTFILSNYSNFVKTSITYMWSNALANPVGKALQVVFKNFYTEVDKDDKVWLSSWSSLITENMKVQSLRKNIQNYLLPYLFKVSTEAFKMFIQDLAKSHMEDELSIMLISLRTGQDLGIVDDSFEGDEKLISLNLLSDLMSSEKEFFRIESFALMTTSARGSKPISPAVLNLVLTKLDVFLTESNLEVRNEFVSLFKKFILRLRDSSYAIHRKSTKLLAKGKFPEEAQSGLAEIDVNKQFLGQLIDVLCQNMRPGSSFQRNNLALKLMSILVRSGLDNTVDKKFYEKLHMDYPFNIPIFNNSKITRLLIDNIANDFEEVRDLSINILSMASIPIQEFIDADVLSLVLKRGFEMLGDLRGRSADSGAKVMQFLYANGAQDSTILDQIVAKLTESVQFAKENFTLAVYEANVHGYYLALNTILNGISTDDVHYYHDILQDIVSTVFQIWELTRPVLTHDSPEGNLPKELQSAIEPSKKHLETKYGPATQVILSYSWRSVKESTALLSSILNTFSDEILFDNSSISLNDIGLLLIEQLSTIRHPGAFSSVYPTFVSCCHRCYRTNQELLAQSWLEKNISLIEDQSHSITRRSGGLPFLITAILTAEYSSLKKKRKKNEIPPLFQQTFEKLYHIATQPFNESTGEETLELPQVHALNSIKFIFIESQLSEICNHYVDRSLDLALSKFATKHWSMRNASVMLFTALQNRLFGTKKIDTNHLSTISARLFFSRYKGLQQVLLRNFERALSSEAEVENLFPILTILSRLHFVPGYTPVLDFKPLLLQSLQNKYWKVREMAARALPCVVDDDAYFEQIADLIQLVHFGNNNELHGFLLAIKELLIRSQIRKGHEQDYVPKNVCELLFEIMDKVISGNYSCSVTYVEILDIVFRRNNKYQDIPPALVSKLGSIYIEHDQLSSLNGAQQLFSSRLLSLLLRSYLEDQDLVNMCDLAKLGMVSQLYECQLAGINFITQNIDKVDSVSRAEMIEILWNILESDSWTLVKASGFILLKDLLVLQDYKNVDLNARKDLLLHFVQDESEDIKATALECLGSFVSKIEDSTLFEVWLELITKSSEDDIPYQLRYSALNSCISFVNVWKGNLDQLLRVLVKLHQFLYDDDEDIREEVSSFISKELLKSRFTLTSTEVEKRYLDYLKLKYSQETLVAVVFQRYIEKLEAFDIEIHDESALFNVEKSNFYKNPVDEMKFYMALLGDSTDSMRNSLTNVVSSLSVKVNDLLKIDKDALGVFKSEDYFNLIYIICLNINNFKLLISLPQALLHDRSLHPLIKELN